MKNNFKNRLASDLSIVSSLKSRLDRVLEAPDRVVALDQIKVEMVLALYVFIFNRPLLYVKR